MRIISALIGFILTLGTLTAVWLRARRLALGRSALALTAYPDLSEGRPNGGACAWENLTPASRLNRMTGAVRPQRARRPLNNLWPPIREPTCKQAQVPKGARPPLHLPPSAAPA